MWSYIMDSGNLFVSRRVCFSLMYGIVYFARQIFSAHKHLIGFVR